MIISRSVLLKIINISDKNFRDKGKKVKIKAVYGSYSTAALRHVVLLPE